MPLLGAVGRARPLFFFCNVEGLGRVGGRGERQDQHKDKLEAITHFLEQSIEERETERESLEPRFVGVVWRRAATREGRTE